MKFLEPSKAMSLGLCFALILVFGATVSNAQQMTKVSGTISAVITQKEPINVGDTDGHVVNLRKSEGTNENTGKQAFMAGAHVANISYSDVVKGNGSNQGYVTFAEDSDTIVAKWEGVITTTTTPEGTSNTNIEGTLTYIQGAGKYANISGSGTYKGNFISENEYSVEWQGEYSLKK